MQWVASDLDLQWGEGGGRVEVGEEWGVGGLGCLISDSVGVGDRSVLSVSFL